MPAEPTPDRQTEAAASRSRSGVFMFVYERDEGGVVLDPAGLVRPRRRNALRS
jgi:hypothetical protein